MWAVVFFAVGSLFFRIVPDAFVACPESLFEVRFYRLDCRIKADSRQPQVLIQGTSRLGPIGWVPIGPRNWKSDDQMLNVSTPGNTFWHMLALHRRNPGLADRTEFAVIDLLPIQLAIGRNFTEYDALFLRESTLSEKLRISDPIVRIKALVDVAIPAWSHRHSFDAWRRALGMLGATPAQRLEALLAIPDESFDAQQRMIEAFDETGQDSAKMRELVANLVYSLEVPSAVQRGALADLVAQFPDTCWVVLARPPFAEDFARIVSDADGQTQEALLREAAEAVTSDRVQLLWLDDAVALDLTAADYAGDGLHFSSEGVKKLQNYLGALYRKRLAAGGRVE